MVKSTNVCFVCVAAVIVSLACAAFRMDSDSAQQQQPQLPHALQSKQQQQQSSSVLKRPREQSLSGPSAEMDPFAASAAAAGDAMDEDMQHAPAASAAALPPLPPHKSAGGSSGGARQQPQQQQAEVQVDAQPSFRMTPSGQHYYELDDPAAALAALEHDMAALMTEVEAQVSFGCLVLTVHALQAGVFSHIWSGGCCRLKPA